MKTLLVACLVVVSLALASFASAQAPIIVAADGTYLGTLSANPYDQNSVSNPYGPYGSPYSSTSINNPYGIYGSPYSNLSPNNPYATAAPRIYGAPSPYLYVSPYSGAAGGYGDFLSRPLFTRKPKAGKVTPSAEQALDAAKRGYQQRMLEREADKAREIVEQERAAIRARSIQ